MRTTGKGLRLILTAVALAACKGGTGGGAGDVDTALLTKPGGDVMLAGGGTLAYEITSDRFRQWQTARAALRAQGLGLTMRIDPLRVTEAEIQQAVSYFERNGKARRAIENAGISVRDYVLTTIALEQQMAVASGRWGESARPRTPPTPVAPVESISAELARDTAGRQPVDTVPVVDTVIVPVDTTRRRPTPPRTPQPLPPPPDTTATIASGRTGR